MRIFRPLLALLLFPTLLPAEQPAAWLKQNLGDIVKVYQEFHKQPELSFQEEKTAERIAREWRSAGYDVTTGVGGHGVVAILKNGDGPVLMLRTDLDALPVTEQTGLVYASTVKVKTKEGVETGVMHACGHDIHMANLVGVARYMAANKNLWQGTLMLIGQPAEERGNGAHQMLKDGLFERFPKPTYAVALHVDSKVAANKIEVKQGFILANVDTVDITMRGRGGHGASPHSTIDPIVQAAELVMSLQTLVSRETNPIDPAVVTVGSIHGGTKHNIISDSCHLQLTVRSYSAKVRKNLVEGIRRKALAVAAGANAPEPTFKFSEEGTPALFNDEKLTARLAPVFARAIGEQNVDEGEASMGGEDFSFYGIGTGVPIMMYRLGSVEAKRLAGLERGGMQAPSLHSAQYYPDAEETLTTGITTMCAAALELLARPAK